MLSNSCSPSTASYSDGKIVHCKVKSALHALEGYPLDPASLVLKVQITLYKSNNNPPLPVKRGGKKGKPSNTRGLPPPIVTVSLPPDKLCLPLSLLFSPVPTTAQRYRLNKEALPPLPCPNPYSAPPSC